MSHLIARLSITVISIIVFSVFLCACNDDDDDSADDDGTDDDVTDDDAVDDDATDDDAVDDDAVDDDDNTSIDDDAGDDDTSPESPTQILLITGKSDDKLVSWVKTDEDWNELVVPQQGSSGGMDYEDFGPIAVRDGIHVQAAINRYEAFGKSKALYLRHSLGHTWLTLNLQSGWQLDEQLPVAGESVNIHHLQIPAPGNLWVGSEYLYEEADNGIPFGHYHLFFYDDLLNYIGQTRDLESHLLYQKMTALSVPTEEYGMAWINKAMGDELWAFNGSNWSVDEIPVAFENIHIDWFWLLGPGSGYALGYEAETYKRHFFEQNDGAWAEVTPPTGCENTVPKYVFATDEYAIGLPEYGYVRVVWEKRNDQWQCRDLSTQVEDWYSIHASVTQDAHAYIVMDESYLHPVLLEVDADTVTKIELPEDLERILSVHVLGSVAPPFGYSPGWFM